MTDGADPRLGRLGVWGHLDSLGIHALGDYVGRVDELGYDTLWVPETVGREPFSLLGLVAASAGRLRLGTSIASIWGRDAQTMRMAAMTLIEATGGRFVLGLGVSHPHLAEKLRGHRFDRPVSRMRDYLAAYRRAVYRGPTLEAAPQPPVLVAALRERMLDLAASLADGAFPYLATSGRVRWMRDRLDAAAAAGQAPRSLLAVTLPVVLEDEPATARKAARAYLMPYLRTPTYRASWEAQGFAAADWERPGSDRLVDAMVAWGGSNAVRERIAEMFAAGADHVALIPLTREGQTEELATLERLAS